MRPRVHTHTHAGGRSCTTRALTRPHAPQVLGLGAVGTEGPRRPPAVELDITASPCQGGGCTLPIGAALWAPDSWVTSASGAPELQEQLLSLRPVAMPRADCPALGASRSPSPHQGSGLAQQDPAGTSWTRLVVRATGAGREPLGTPALLPPRPPRSWLGPACSVFPSQNLTRTSPGCLPGGPGGLGVAS